jgi:hypothetical protein
MKSFSFAFLFLCTSAVMRSYSQTAGWEWAKCAHENDNTVFNAMCSDDQGNIYAVGSFQGTSLTFDSLTIYNPFYNHIAGDWANFLHKFNADGKVEWAKKIPWRGAYINALSCDHENNLLIAGQFENEVLIDSLHLTSDKNYNIFLAKLDPFGNALSADYISSDHELHVVSIATDLNDDVCLLGRFNDDTLRLGGFSLPGKNINQQWNNYWSDFFVLKWRKNGELAWLKGGGCPQNDWPAKICTDKNKNVIVTGFYTSSPFQFDTMRFDQQSQRGHLFVIKMDSSGNCLWAKTDDADDHTDGTDVVCDKNGNIFLCGNMTSSFNFASAHFEYDGKLCWGDHPCPHSFIAKLNPNGETQWAKVAAGDYYDRSVSLDVDENGNAYLAGAFEGTKISFGNTSGENSYSWYGSDAYLTKFTSGGESSWIKIIGGASDENPADVLCSGNKIYTIGNFSSYKCGLDSIRLYNSWANVANVYIAKLGELVSGVEENDSSVFSVFPNPCGGNFSVSIPNSKNTKLRISSIIGEVYLEKEFNSAETMINVEDLPPGIYFVEIFRNERRVIKKLIVE